MNKETKYEKLVRLVEMALEAMEKGGGEPPRAGILRDWIRLNHPNEI